MKANGAGSGGMSSGGPLAMAPGIEVDMTCQAFSQWLTELRARSSRTLQEMLSEMSIIRDGITSNNVELSDFKRHSTGISQDMQAQLTHLREKLTDAFSEITALVRTKTQSDQEIMQDINDLEQNLSVKTQELEALKKSYSQAHSQLQSSLIQIQNYLQVTNSEVQQARSACDRVQRDMGDRFIEINSNLRALEDDINTGNAENRNQMLQLQEDIARIHDAIANVSAEFNDHKRATNSVQNKFQSHVWGIEEARKRKQQAEQQAAARQHVQGSCGSYESMEGMVAGTGAKPALSTSSVELPGTQQVARAQAGAVIAQPQMVQLRPGSANLPAMVPSTASTAMIQAAMPTRSSVVITAPSAPAAARPQPAGSALAPIMYRPVR